MSEMFPVAIFVLTTFAVSLCVLGLHKRRSRTQENRAKAINWNAFVFRYMGNAKRQKSRFHGYLMRHTFFLTGNQEAAKHMSDQIIRWMITLFMFGVGFGALFRSLVLVLVGASLILLPLYNLKRRYFLERQVFYQELLTGGYIAFPYMLQAGVSIEESLCILAQIGSGSFQRTIQDVCWLSGLPVLKNGQAVRLLAKPLTVIEALEEVSQRSDSKAFLRWVRQIKIALDKRISVADKLFEDGKHFVEDRKRKREHQKGKVGFWLKRIIDMGMPSVMTVFMMLELSQFIHFILTKIGAMSMHNSL